MTTTYIVMKREGDSLSLLGSTECSGPLKAIRELSNQQPGTYVAVPKRNWSELTAEVVQMEPKLVLRGSDTPAQQTTIEDALADSDQHSVLA